MNYPSRRVAHGIATTLPALDFETYSEAGYVWNEDTNKWESLPGHSNQSRGLKAVGIRNYVEHPTFNVLCLAYDLLTDGPHLWLPLHPRQPDALLEHVRKGGVLSAWNTEFEWTVWNIYCVPTFGWPPLDISQMSCDMAKSAANSYPRKLKEAGAALMLTNQKHADGDRLIRKLTVPKNPTKKLRARRWTP